MEAIIHATGFFRQKAKSVIGLSKALVAEHGGRVPADMDALVALPGVGRKTANVVLGHALGVPGLPVDRHVLRVAGRLGLIHTDDAVKAEARADGAVAARALDARVRHADPAWPAHLPADATVRDLPRPHLVCLCDHRRHHHRRPSSRRATGARRHGRGPASPRRPRPPHPPPLMTRERFRALVAEAIDSIPTRFATHVRNVAIVIEEAPSAELLAEMDIAPPDTLLGLYQGTPLTERRWDHGNDLPDRVLLFQRPIEEDAAEDGDVVGVIGETLIHELGHYFGLSEDEIMAIEDRYWRGEPEPGDSAGDDTP